MILIVKKYNYNPTKPIKTKSIKKLATQTFKLLHFMSPNLKDT